MLRNKTERNTAGPASGFFEGTQDREHLAIRAAWVSLQVDRDQLSYAFVLHGLACFVLFGGLRGDMEVTESERSLFFPNNIY